MSDQIQIWDAPYSPEAEQAVLGAVLLNPDVWDLVVGIITSTSDFYNTRHALIFEAMRALAEQQIGVDYVSVLDQLEKTITQQGVTALEACGGEAFIIGLATNTPSASNVEVYARIVERAAVRRKLMRAGDQIRLLAMAEDKPVTDSLNAAVAVLDEVVGTGARQNAQSVRQIIVPMMDRIEDQMLNGVHYGVASGFKDLDVQLGGFQPSDLAIVAARPGVGKTSFLLSVAINAARQGSRVAIFSLEMSAEQLVQRFVSMETRISMQQLRTGQISQQEWRLLNEATGRLSKLQIFIDDTPSLSPAQLRSKCKRLQHDHGLDLVIVDYIQLMTVPGAQYQNNRVQEISAISRDAKEIAKTLNVPIIAAAQLSRAVEMRADKRPILSDLRESGSLEQDTDVVMFLYRDAMYNDASETPNQADVIIAKHRNGATGTVSLHFDNASTRFSDPVTVTV